MASSGALVARPEVVCPDWTGPRGLEGAEIQHASGLEREKGHHADTVVHVKVVEGRREDALRGK